MPRNKLNLGKLNVPGKLDLAKQINCSNPVAGAQSYVIEQSLQAPPNAAWTHVKTTTKSSHTVTGLTSGTRYYFRVAAVSPSGQSGWSDILHQNRSLSDEHSMLIALSRDASGAGRATTVRLVHAASIHLEESSRRPPL